MLKHKIADAVEFIYTVKPAISSDDLAFSQKLNRLAREQVLSGCRKGPASPFTFDVGGLLEVEVNPLPPGAFIDPSITHITIRRQESKPTKGGEFFSAEIRYPHPDYQGRIDHLLGLDPIIRQVKGVMLSQVPGYLEVWARKHHPLQANIRKQFNGTPAMLFYGDPGLGKTELALSVGDWLARKTGYPVQLLKLDLSVRGSGHVGEFTKNIGDVWRKVMERHLATDGLTIFLIDEADALVQPRAQGQQHHEDQAAVDAIIQQLDLHQNVGIVVILITNLIDHTDPAVRRRAVHKFHFPRPDTKVRRQLFDKPLLRTLPPEVLDEMAELTEGYTPHDIQAIYDNVIMRAFMVDSPISAELLWDVVGNTQPTPSATA